ncbi:VOC family protein [Kiritimatiellaeota bacterium B1221]|nr:VOC family protein [Kiritimatiellaeota bacterium B1221]
MITSMDHLNIVVRDLDLVSDFFVKLGFRIEDRAGLSGPWISEIVGLENVQAEYVKLAFPGTAVRLELIRYDSPHSDQPVNGGEANDPGFRHLAFAVEKIDTVVDQLKEEGISFFSPVQTYEKTGKRLVYFRGPEGILLELAEYCD